MHDNEAFNAWKVLQRSKKLDQGPKEHCLFTTITYSFQDFSHKDICAYITS